MENQSKRNRPRLKYAQIMAGSEVELNMYRAQVKTLQKAVMKKKAVFKKHKQAIDKIEKKQDEELKRLNNEEKSLKKHMGAIKAAYAKIDKEVDKFKKIDSHLSQKLTDESKKVKDLQKQLEDLRTGDWEDLEDWHTDDPELNFTPSMSTNSMAKGSSSRSSKKPREANSRDYNHGFIIPGKNASLQKSSRQSESRRHHSQKEKSRHRRVERKQPIDSQESLNYAIQRESQMGNKTLDEIADISSEHQMLPEELSPTTPARQMKSKRRY